MKWVFTPTLSIQPHNLCSKHSRQCDQKERHVTLNSIHISELFLSQTSYTVTVPVDLFATSCLLLINSSIKDCTETGRSVGKMFQK